jgi:lipopolysaccharide biosynthesis protein
MGFFKIKKRVKDNNNSDVNNVDFNNESEEVVEERLVETQKSSIKKKYTGDNKGEPYMNKQSKIIKVTTQKPINKFFIKNNDVIDYSMPDINETFGVIDNINKVKPFPFRQRRLAVFIHMYYPDLWDVLDSYLDNIKCGFDLYVNMVIDNYDQETVYKIVDKYPNAKVIKNINKGRDIGGLITMSKYIVKNQYDSVYFIHTKKSPHLKSGHVWRADMLNSLMGNETKITNLIKDIRYNNVGLIAPGLYLTKSIGSNYTNLKRLLKLYGIDYDLNNLEFSAGTFFLCSADLIEEIGSAMDLFYFEDGSSLDGQMAHAFERFLPILTIKKINKTTKYV